MLSRNWFENDVKIQKHLGLAIKCACQSSQHSFHSIDVSDPKQKNENEMWTPMSLSALRWIFFLFLVLFAYDLVPSNISFEIVCHLLIFTFVVVVDVVNVLSENGNSFHSNYFPISALNVQTQIKYQILQRSTLDNRICVYCPFHWIY